jgi:RNA polymerase sigma factor (sigma-70 family)
VVGVQAALDRPTLDDAAARQLCSKAQAGDRDAEAALCDSFMGLALSMVAAFNKTSPDPACVEADDLFSVAMMAGLQYGVRRYKVDGEVPFSNWVALCMRKMLTRTVGDEVKRSMRLNENMEAIVQQWYPDSWDRNTDPTEYADTEHRHTVNKGDMKRLLDRAEEMQVLSTRQMQAIRHRMDGLSSGETSKRMCCHRNTVMGYYREAITILRELIAEDIEGVE